MAVLDVRQRTGWLFLAVTVGHIILISAQVTTRRGIPLLEEVTFGAFAEVQRAASSVFGGIREGWQNYFALQQIRQENEQLRQENSQLQIRLQQERAQAQQSRTLEGLLGMHKQTPVATTGAVVIGASASPEFRTLTLDKGTQDGLSADMAVVAPAGVVGRIIIPSARASKVQLLIDSNASAGAMIERSRAQGLIEGTGSASELRMTFVGSAADVKNGDVVVTSGIEGIYPKGFVIGRIESIQRKGGEFDIKVRPGADFANLEAVLVVLTPPPPITETELGEEGTTDATPGRRTPQ